MRLIYLASPYFHKDEAVMDSRVQALGEALAYFARESEETILYSPISHWHHVAKRNALPRDFNFWSQRDFFMIRKASAMWVLTTEGWEESYGISQELEYADSIEREVVYIIRDNLNYRLTDARPTRPIPLPIPDPSSTRI